MTLGMMECKLRAREALRVEYLALNKLVAQIAMRDELCRRLIAITGVGLVTALSFKTAINVSTRFRRSRDVAAHFGLKSIDVQRRISEAGDLDVRRALFKAPSAFAHAVQGA